MSQPVIGFIGLGIMGGPMSKHLLGAGYRLMVHDLNRAAVQELLAEGANEAFSPKEVALQSRLIITVLPDSPDVEMVALGPNGLAEGVSEGDIYIDMSTIAPSSAIKVANALAGKGAQACEHGSRA
jgi:2-hydroxy-3-oxopropionate reductase